MKRIYLFVMTLLAVALMSSCGKTPGNENDKEEPIKIYGPTESKEFFEQTAKDVMAYFNPADQREVYDFAMDFVTYYGDYGFEMGDYYSASICNYFTSIAQAAAKNDLLAADYNTVYDFSMISGIYEPDDEDYMWRYVGMSDDLIMKFTLMGDDCQVKVVVSDDNWLFEHEGLRVEVPTEITVTIDKEDEQMFKHTIRSMYNEAARTAFFAVTYDVANFEATLAISASNYQIIGEESFRVDDKLIEKVTTTINGNNLCNIEKIKHALNYGSFEDVDNFFTDAKVEIQILDRINIMVKAEEFYRIVTLIDDYSSDESGVKSLVNSLNKYIKAEVYYNGNTTLQATLLLFAKEYNNYYDGMAYWVPGVMIEFADDSRYDVESYFGEGNFDSVVNTFEKLLRAYRNAFDI